MMLRETGRLWVAVAAVRKPMTANVRGCAFGGVFELALNTDIIVAGENVVFGQSELQ